MAADVSRCRCGQRPESHSGGRHRGKIPDMKVEGKNEDAVLIGTTSKLISDTGGLPPLELVWSPNRARSARGGNRAVPLTPVDIERNPDQGYRGQCTDAFDTPRGSQI